MFTVNNSEFLIQSKISCCWLCKRESAYHLIQKYDQLSSGQEVKQTLTGLNAMVNSIF